MATIKTISSIQPALEAMSLQITDGEYWLGGSAANNDGDYIWEDGTDITINSWAPEYPLTGKIINVLIFHKEYLHISKSKSEIFIIISRVVLCGQLCTRWISAKRRL